MGRRAALFYSARDCVNALHCAKPNDEMYDKNFGLCMTLLTRQKLIKCAHEIITDIYKKRPDPKKLRRFYKLNTLHMFQLEKYKAGTGCPKMCPASEKEYLQKISYMISSLHLHSP